MKISEFLAGFNGEITQYRATDNKSGMHIERVRKGGKMVDGVFDDPIGYECSLKDIFLPEKVIEEKPISVVRGKRK